MKKYDERLSKSIGRRMKQVRESHDMTQDQVADAMQITVKHLSMAERGKSRFSYEYMISFCKVLDTSMDYIIRGRSSLGEDVQIPQSIIETLNSKDDTVRRPLIEYLNLYTKLKKGN